MRTGIKVGDAMTTKPVTAEVGMTVKDCAKLMKKFDVGSVMIKENDAFVGIVTEYDLTRKVIATGIDYESPIEEVMENVLMTVSPDQDLFDAMESMRENEIRHLPVVEGDKFVGLITMKDILKIEPQLFELIVEKIRLREEFRKPINEVTGEEGICEVCSNYSESLYDVDGSKVCRECTGD